MTRKQAEETVDWLEDQLTVDMSAWQKRFMTLLLMSSDTKFDVRIPRAGRSC